MVRRLPRFFSTMSRRCGTFGVFAGALVVGDKGDAAGFEDADDLASALRRCGCVVDIVEAEIGDDDVEGGNGERNVCAGG